MYNLEKINKAIRDIESYFPKLKSIGLSKENINNDEKFFSSSMIIFGILNRMNDLAEEILIKLPCGMPTSYVEYYECLGKEGIVDNKLATELKKLAKDRNLFAHEYYNMQRKEVLRMSKDIYFVRDFVERIKKHVAREEKRDEK